MYELNSINFPHCCLAVSTNSDMLYFFVSFFLKSQFVYSFAIGGHLGCFCFSDIINKASISISYTFIYEHIFLFLFDNILEVEYRRPDSLLK